MTPKLTVDLGLRHEYYTPFIGLADQGGAVELRSGDQHAAGRRLRQRRRERRRAEVLEEFRSARRRVVPSQREDSRARRLRREHAAVPGQLLRLQLPGEAEQRLQCAEQLRPGRLDGRRVPGAGLRRRFRRTASSTRAPPCCATRATSTRVRTSTRDRCTRSTPRFQRELPGRFTLDVAYVGNRGHDVADPVQRERRRRRRAAGQQRTAALPAVRQVRAT